MANRVVLGAFDGTYVLRVSLPGINVLSTGLSPEQLAFDSRWSEIGKEVLSGVSANDSVSFGMTFSKQPIVIVRYKVSSTYPNEYTGPTFRFVSDVESEDTSSLVVTTSGFTHHDPVGRFGNMWYTVYENFFD